MRRVGPLIMLIVGLLGRATYAQDHVLCTTTPPTSFTVTSGAPFTITWLMPANASENGVTVPNRFEGYYVQIDGGPKTDIGKATPSTPCSTGTLHPNDVPTSYKTPQGVAKGSHTLRLSAWSFTLDGQGNPTTTKQESAIATVPFTAGDPTLYGPPAPPYSVTITKSDAAVRK